MRLNNYSEEKLEALHAEVEAEMQRRIDLATEKLRQMAAKLGKTPEDMFKQRRKRRTKEEIENDQPQETDDDSDDTGGTDHGRRHWEGS